MNNIDKKLDNKDEVNLDYKNKVNLELNSLYINLLSNSKSIEPEIVDMVNRNFKKLLLKL